MRVEGFVGDLKAEFAVLLLAALELVLPTPLLPDVLGADGAEGSRGRAGGTHAHILLHN